MRNKQNKRNMYEIVTRGSFPHTEEMYDVVKDGVWYASFAFYEDAENYVDVLNTL